MLAFNVVTGVAVNVIPPLGVPAGGALMETVIGLVTATTVTEVVLVHPVPVITIPGTNTPERLVIVNELVVLLT
jgi:hypothetical protein